MKKPMRQLERRHGYALLLHGMGMSYKEVGKLCRARFAEVRSQSDLYAGRNMVKFLSTQFGVGNGVELLAAAFRYGYLRWENGILVYEASPVEVAWVPAYRIV